MRTRTGVQEQAPPAGSLVNEMADAVAAQPAGLWSFRLLLCASLTCMVVGAVHWPVLQAKALSTDDGQYYLHNLLVQNPSLRSLRLFFSEVLHPSSVSGYYQPLTMVSLMADDAAAGKGSKMAAFHRTSLGLHVLNAGSLTILLYLFFKNPWIAGGVGLLFGVHPLTAAEVAWISERKTLLATFFALWSLILYVQWTRKRTRGSYVGCAVCYVSGMLAKPTCLTLPLMMLLMDFWPLRRLTWSAVKEKIPLFSAMGILGAVVFVSQQQSPAGLVVDYQSGVPRLALIVCYNLMFYLSKIVAPVRLSEYAPFPQPLALTHPAVLCAVMGACLLSVLATLSWRWTRAWFASWLLFMVALAPAVNVVQVDSGIACNRHIYLPAVGVVMLLAWLGSWLWTNRRIAGARRGILAAVFLVLATGECAGARRQLVYWRDSVSLCRYMLTIYPQEDKLQASLGYALERAGHLDECISAYSQAAAMNPGVAHYEYCLGDALIMRGDTRTGIRHLREAEKLRYGPAIMRLGWIFATHPDPNVCNPQEALACAKRVAHRVNHRYPEALACLAAAWAAGGQYEHAIAMADKALRLAADHRYKDLVSEIAEHLRYYRHGKRFQEDPCQRYRTDVIRCQEL